ncbi:MAG: beta-ketoacyl-[acyl-carrier-protein] synthase family protein [Verrucomicrobia bacterium]|nr:beta-ketoacyl-[acyl-carrier-protein] synthase family protein [Verrucomicrobiota bacterium]
MNNRVVITGIGVCSPVGGDAVEFWQNLLAGKSGIGPVTLFDTSTMTVRIGGEAKGLDPARFAREFPEAGHETDRKIRLGLTAADQAIRDAALGADALRTAWVFVGVSLESFPLEQAGLAAGAGDLIQSLAARHGVGLQTPLDRLAQLMGGHYGFNGGQITNCSACAAGAQVVGEAFRRLRAGQGEVAVTGAADSVLNPLGLGGFSLLRILSTENEHPQQACRPFDATRQGTVLGEGAAFLVLETLPHARHRGARIYAEVLGYGTSLDAFRATDPEPGGKGAVRSMQRTLADAGLQPEEVDAVNAHGTGTPKNDIAETSALKEALGPRTQAIPVTANKSMTGHLIAASGALEAAASALTLHTGWLPPTINLEHPDPQCDLDCVTEGKRAFAGKVVLSNSFGFGGQNATLIFGKYDD